VKSSIGAWLKDEQGQVLPVVALMLVVFLGIAALALDVGRALCSYRALQAATDAAALAGAQALGAGSPLAGVTGAATLYSAVAGNKNAHANLPGVTMVSGYPLVKCLATMVAQGAACVGTVPDNAVQVRQQQVMRMYFAGLFGHPTITITTTATASTRGASPTPYNVALIVDTTPSMSEQDANCGTTQILCALGGVRVLLQALDPCAASLAACQITSGVSANSVDRVSLFTFPQVTTASAGMDYDCGSSAPTATAYTFPPATGTSYSTAGTTTYQISTFHSDYRASDTAVSLNVSSSLTEAAGAKSGCSGMGPPSNAGSFDTYYAATIYAAQAALVAEQAANPGSQNVMIILSDGDATATQTMMSQYNAKTNPTGATASGTYPSWVGECGQGVVAAQAATAAGTRVYTVAYGSEPAGCTSDKNAGAYPNITPCDAMADMASAPQYFFSDYQQTGSKSTCSSTAQAVTALSDIFTAIAGNLTVARLIPDNTP
jgi:hypothetical protein